MDKIRNPQAVLDSDDEMDDIMTEFAKTENESDIIELSNESSADEMDDLIDEFANNQSDSDTDEKKMNTKVVLSSDDDNEMENLLEEFREENATDNSLLLKNNNDKMENKSIVSDTDNRNGIVFNNTFEILYSEDSGDKSSDENVFKSTTKESPCLSSPKSIKPKVLEFQIRNKTILKQEPGYENEYDITKHNSGSFQENKIITSSESGIKVLCKKESNVDISEEENIEDELYSKSKKNSESKISEKEPSLNNNNNASVCKNSTMSCHSLINKTNLGNLCEENGTEHSQENISSFNIKISCVSSVLNSEDNAVMEDSKRNLIHSSEDNSINASHLSVLENKADKSHLNQIKNLIHGLKDNVPNAVHEKESLTVDNFYVCKTNTKYQENLNTDEVSYNGVPIGGGGSSKKGTVIRTGFKKYADSKKKKNDEVQPESKPEILSPFHYTNHNSNNFSRNGDILEVQEENNSPTSVASSSSVTHRVTKRSIEPSESSSLSNGLQYKRTKLPTDHLTKYFQSVEETVRTFPMQLQLEAKKRISELISELEYKSYFFMCQNERPQLYHYTQRPHSFHHSNSHLQQSCEIYSYSGCIMDSIASTIDPQVDTSKILLHDHVEAPLLDPSPIEAVKETVEFLIHSCSDESYAPIDAVESSHMTESKADRKVLRKKTRMETSMTKPPKVPKTEVSLNESHEEVNMPAVSKSEASKDLGGPFSNKVSLINATNILQDMKSTEMQSIPEKHPPPTIIKIGNCLKPYLPNPFEQAPCTSLVKEELLSRSGVTPTAPGLTATVKSHPTGYSARPLIISLRNDKKKQVPMKAWK